MFQAMPEALKESTPRSMEASTTKINVTYYGPRTVLDTRDTLGKNPCLRKAWLLDNQQSM